MLPHKQQNKPVCAKNKHLLYPPTILERCRMEGEAGSQWGQCQIVLGAPVNFSKSGRSSKAFVFIRTTTSTELSEKVFS